MPAQAPAGLGEAMRYAVLGDGKRIRPLLVYATAGAIGVAHAADGKAVYDKTCVACHASGVANAPKLGDKAAWAPRIKTGFNPKACNIPERFR